MIVEVYPLKRMPRKFICFDYTAPDNAPISRGAFVNIPFRNKTVTGVVKRVKERPLCGIELKSIQTIITDTQLREEELSFFELIAKNTAQSISTILYTALPQPPKREQHCKYDDQFTSNLTIPSQESPIIARLSKQMTERRNAFVQSPDLRRTAVIIARYLYGKTNQKSMIICPNVRDADLLKEYLHEFKPLCVTGNETNNRRFDMWKQFRSLYSGLLITTRAGVFFCDATTTCLFVVRSSHTNHVQHDRNPRIDSRLITKLFSERFATNLFFFDVCARVDDYVYFGKENILDFPILTEIEFINFASERTISSHSVITSSAQTAIKQTLSNNKKILIAYNKKGYARRLTCANCGKSIICSKCGHLAKVLKETIQCIKCCLVEPMLLHCPNCSSTQIKQIGYGAERLAETIQKWYTDVSIQTVNAENPNFNRNCQITLATNFYLENYFNPFVENIFDCVLCLDIDTALFSPDFRAQERAITLLYEWIGVAQSNHAKLLVQTEEENLFKTFINNSMKMLNIDAQTRASFNQPPFQHWTKIVLKDDEKKKLELDATMLKERLENINGAHIMINYLSDNETCSIIVRVPKESQEELINILTTLEDRYIIDTNAFEC